MSNTEKQNRNLSQCNILVIGKSGVGKSSLINAIFGENHAKTGTGKSVTDKIQKHTKDGDINIYDSPGFTMTNKSVLDNIISVLDNIWPNENNKKADFYWRIKQQEKLHPNEHIHIVWYCINETSDRLEEIEKESIKKLKKKEIPVILVLTKGSQEESSRFIDFLKKETDYECEIIRVKEDPKIINGILLDRNGKASEEGFKSDGLEELVSTTTKLLPEVAKIAFNKAIKKEKRTAKIWLMAYVVTTFPLAMASSQTIPFIGPKASVAATQFMMLTHLSNIFGLEFDLSLITQLFLTATGIESGVETIMNEELLQNVLSELTQEIISDGFTDTMTLGIIPASSGAFSTLLIGLAYIEVLQTYKQNQKRQGEKIDPVALGEMLREQIKDCVQPSMELFKKIIQDYERDLQTT